MVLLFEILLLVGGVFLVGAILMQHGKSHGLSGSISGGAETFFGKEKASGIDSRLSKATSIIGVVFVVIALVVYIIQPTYSSTYSYKHLPSWQYMSEHYTAPSTETEEEETESTTESTTEAPTDETTAAAE